MRESLSDYSCEILTCVTEGEQAFAKMHFSGRHTAPFRGYEPTGKLVHWLGAALFRFEGDRVAEYGFSATLSDLMRFLRKTV